MGVDLKSRFSRWRHKRKEIENRELRVVLDKTSFARFERLRTRMRRADDAKLIDLALKCLEKKIAIIIEQRSACRDQPQNGERLELQQRLSNLIDPDPLLYAEGDQRRDKKDALLPAKQRKRNRGSSREFVGQ